MNEGSGVSYFHFDREYGIMLLVGRGDNSVYTYHFDKSTTAIMTLLG